MISACYTEYSKLVTGIFNLYLYGYRNSSI